MNESEPVRTVFKPEDLKLYVYGCREADQFWVPNGNSYSRKPFCLTDVEKFTFNNDEEEDAPKEPIPNPLFNQVVSRIACGSIHSVVLLNDGRVFTFGCNDEGALGRDGIECIPIQVKVEDPIDLIAAGDNHSLFANSVNGAIYFTGNYNYKRGEMMRDPVRSPIRIYAHEINIHNKNKPIQKLACGSNHSCVLIGGRLYCRGEPEASTIGRRMSKRHKVENSLTFNGVNLSNVIDVECGGYHTVAICEKGGAKKYYSWGTNDHGQLGIGSFESQAFPTEIKKLRGKDIVHMAGGSSFTLFLEADGTLYGCGNNEYNMLGLGEDYECPEEDESEEQSEESKKGEQEKSPENQMVDEAPKESSMQPESAEKAESKEEEKSNVKVGSQPSSDQPQNIVPESQQVGEAVDSNKMSIAQKEEAYNKLYIKNITQIPVPEKVTGIAAGDNFGFAWNKQSMYSWGMGIGYVLLTGEENDEMEIFKVKNKIINNHTIYQLDAGSQHVMYTSYPETIDDKTVKVEPKPSVYENLSIAKHGLKRKR